MNVLPEGDLRSKATLTREELAAETAELRRRPDAAESSACTLTRESGPATPLPEHRPGKRRTDAEPPRSPYSDLYDFAPLGYVTLDAKGTIRAINLTGARLLGTPRPALVGTALTSRMSEDDGRNFLKHLRQCRQSSEQRVLELCITARDGAAMQVQLSTVKARHDGGEIIFHTAITDITELKKTEESLLRLNRLYAVLSETGKAIIHAVDRNTLFEDVCRVAVEHGGFLLAWIGVVNRETGLVEPVASHGKTGYLRGIRISAGEEPDGRGPTGLAISNGNHYICNDFHSDPCTKPWHKRALAGGIRSSAAIALKLNGRAIGALTIYAGEKNFFKWQFIHLLQQMAADISFALDNMEREERRRKTELALRLETAERLRTVEELREKESLLLQQSRQAAMGEMLGNIAHQWRQPLNALGLCIQELGLAYELEGFTREQLDERISQAMTIIFGMSQTIDDFRNFYKPDKEKRWFRVNQVVAKTVSLIEASFREHRIAIALDAVGDPEIKGYHNDYAQVLLNILMNARDAHLERGTADASVAVRVRTENGRSVVTVSDNAGGIAGDVLERIFDLYFTTKENGLGTGIGLFMAKIIIEKNMGGRLSARNARQGAEFRIEV